MSDRMTSASAPGVAPVADYGRKTRAEMIEAYRTYYRHVKQEAERALAVHDEQIIVETYLGPQARKNREVVQ